MSAALAIPALAYPVDLPAQLAQANRNVLDLTIRATEAMRTLADTLPRVWTSDTRIVNAADLVARLDEVLSDLRAGVALLEETRA